MYPSFDEIFENISEHFCLKELGNLFNALEIKIYLLNFLKI